MNKHTPVPWQVSPYNPAGIFTADEMRRQVGAVYDGIHSYDIPLSERLANAAFIVEACNAHEQLVAALLTVCELPFELNPANYDHEDVCQLNESMVRAILAARAALASVTK